jgi:Homoserine dehydrogenase
MTRVDSLDIPDTLAGRARLSYHPHTAAPDSPHPVPRIVRVGLAGCGVVGGALVRLLDQAGDAIEARHGIRFQIARVLVRDLALERGLPIPTHLFTDDVSVLLAKT